MNWRRIATVALVGAACVAATAGTLAVTAAGFALSFDAIRAVGRAAYIRAEWGWLLPVAIDGAIATAMVTAVVLRFLGRSTWYPWLVVIVGAAVSISCNAVHAYLEGGAVRLPPWAAMTVSAIPAVTLALSVHMLIVLAVTVVQQPAPATPATVTPVDTAAAPDIEPALSDTATDVTDSGEEMPDGALSGARLMTADARLLAGALRADFPDMEPAEIGRRVGRSERTVRRWFDADKTPSVHEVVRQAVSQ